MRLAIDLGHGLSNRSSGVYDPGAVGNGLKEANIVRDYGRVVADQMKAKGVPVLVIDAGLVYTRDNRAEAWGATHYLALHCDATTNNTASGSSVWINRGDPQLVRAKALRLSNLVSNALGIADRGVHEKDFAVLSGRQPDMLLETFFISNPNDCLAYKNRRLELIHNVVEFLCGWGNVTTQAPPPPVHYFVGSVDCEVPGNVPVVEQKCADLYAASVTSGNLVSFHAADYKTRWIETWAEGRGLPTPTVCETTKESVGSLNVGMKP